MTTNPLLNFVVIGCGSIGKRHIRNLLHCNAGKVYAFDISEERRKETQDTLGVDVFSSIDECLSIKPDAALICTPNSLHVPYAIQFAQAGTHLFIEKPLSSSMDQIDELIEVCKQNNIISLVGCNLRFHPGLKRIKSVLEQNQIGKIISAECHFGQYLPDWHPWEDYRQGYSARSDLGGGVILDAIHEIDYARWLLGSVTEVVCFGGTISQLEVSTEDNAEILLRFEQNAYAHVHMDYIQRHATRFCRIIGDEGTVMWDNKQNHVEYFFASNKQWVQEPLDEQWDVNQMYVDETAHFIRCIQNKEHSHQTVSEGAASLRIALAAKQSMTDHQIISFESPV